MNRMKRHAQAEQSSASTKKLRSRPVKAPTNVRSRPTQSRYNLRQRRPQNPCGHGNLYNGSRSNANFFLADTNELSNITISEETDVDQKSVPMSRLVLQPVDEELDRSFKFDSSSEHSIEETIFRLHSYYPRTAQPPRDVMNVKTRSMPSIIPMLVDCAVHVTFDKELDQQINSKEGAKRSYIIQDFEWRKEGSYELLDAECLSIATKIMKKDGSNDTSIKNHLLYVRHTSCCVKSMTTGIQYYPQSSSTKMDLAQRAFQTITDFIRAYPCTKFKVEFSYDMGVMMDMFKSGETSREILRRLYRNKLQATKPTIHHQTFFSRADLNELTSDSVCNRLIDNDCKLTKHEKKDLHRLMRKQNARILLAACMYSEMSWEMFKHLLEPPHGYSDDCRPVDGLPNTCQNESCQGSWHDILSENTHKFFPKTVSNDFWFHRRGWHEIVPVSTLGMMSWGCSSHVDEVYIDPAYREGAVSASALSQTHALKVFHCTETSKSPNDDNEKHRNHFQNELEMQSLLASHAHPHISTFSTSWVQRDTFYILYDKADCDLRMYMEKRQGGDLTVHKVFWFLIQLRGLAEAVQLVHNLSDSSAETVTSSLDEWLSHITKGEPGPVHLYSCAVKGPLNNEFFGVKEEIWYNSTSNIVGYHHDIKPENILVSPMPNKLPSFKLSDFGTGRFSFVDAEQSVQPASQALGTRTYFGPEYDPAMDRKMTRPFDIWALGCVYLEMLLWFLGMQRKVTNTGMSLTSLCLLSNDGKGNEEFDYFWERKRRPDQRAESCATNVKPTYDFDLKPQVKKVLTDLLDGYCKDMKPFVQVIGMICQLLKPEPRDRLRATDIVAWLDKAIAQAETDLSEASSDPDFYAKLFKRNHDSIKNID